MLVIGAEQAELVALTFPDSSIAPVAGAGAGAGAGAVCEAEVARAYLAELTNAEMSELVLFILYDGGRFVRSRCRHGLYKCAF